MDDGYVKFFVRGQRFNPLTKIKVMELQIKLMNDFAEKLKTVRRASFNVRLSLSADENKEGLVQGVNQKPSGFVSRYCTFGRRHLHL